MPQQQQQAPPDLLEYTIKAPFTGVQSELPLTQISDIGGFFQADNIVFRKGTIWTRPARGGLIAAGGAQPASQIVSFADFYDSADVRHGCWWHADGTMRRWLNPGGATVPAGGAAISGARRYTWCEVNNSLIFTNGSTILKSWAGGAAAYADLNANAPRVYYVMELATHVLAAHAPSIPARKRVYWSGAGAPTDWTSANSGVTDIFADYGNISGLLKIGQQGYIFHSNGMTMAIPTGIGTRPFDFPPFGAKGLGCLYPYTLVPLGGRGGIFVNGENIWLFDGSGFEPIGDYPIAINGVIQRIGARSAIMADLVGQLPESPNSFITYDWATKDYTTYWLIAGPGTDAVWVYDIGERNWSRFTFGSDIASSGGLLFLSGTGLIYNQIGVPPGVSFTSPTGSVATPQTTDLIAIGGTGGALYSISFGICERAATLRTGALTLRDLRHNKTIHGVRFVFKDVWSSTLTVKLYNERGESITLSNHTNGTDVITSGTTGRDFTTVIPTKFSGHTFMLEIVTQSPHALAISEITFLYDISSPYRTSLFGV